MCFTQELLHTLDHTSTDLALNSVVSGVNIGAVESGSTGILAFSFCNESQEQLTRDNTFEYLNKNRKFQQQLLVARQHEDRRRNIQKAKENLFLSEDDYADDDDPRNRDFDEALKAEIYEEIVRKQGYAQPYLELKKTAPLAVGAYNGGNLYQIKEETNSYRSSSTRPLNDRSETAALNGIDNNPELQLEAVPEMLDLDYSRIEHEQEELEPVKKAQYVIMDKKARTNVWQPLPKQPDIIPIKSVKFIKTSRTNLGEQPTRTLSSPLGKDFFPLENNREDECTGDYELKPTQKNTSVRESNMNKSARVAENYSRNTTQLSPGGTRRKAGEIWTEAGIKKVESIYSPLSLSYMYNKTRREDNDHENNPQHGMNVSQNDRGILGLVRARTDIPLSPYSQAKVLQKNSQDAQKRHRLPPEQKVKPLPSNYEKMRLQESLQELKYSLNWNK